MEMLQKELRKERENPRPAPYFDGRSPIQKHIQPWMRSKVITWLQEVADSGFDFQDESGKWKRGSFESDTVVVAILIFDRFLSVRPVPKKVLQLVGVTCFFIACKLHEVKKLSINYFRCITADSYSIEEIREMELNILVDLKWEVCYVSPFILLSSIFLCFPLIDFIPNLNGAREPLKEAQDCAEKLLQLAFCEYEFFGYPGSVIAIACSLCALQRQQVDYRTWAFAVCNMGGFDINKVAHIADVIGLAFSANLKIDLGPTASSTVGAQDNAEDSATDDATPKVCFSDRLGEGFQDCFTHSHSGVASNQLFGGNSGTGITSYGMARDHQPKGSSCNQGGPKNGDSHTPSEGQLWQNNGHSSTTLEVIDAQMRHGPGERWDMDDIDVDEESGEDDMYYSTSDDEENQSPQQISEVASFCALQSPMEKQMCLKRTSSSGDWDSKSNGHPSQQGEINSKSAFIGSTTLFTAPGWGIMRDV